MEFKISSAELSSLLQSIAKVVPSTSTLPILTCLHFEITDNMLRLTASDSLLRITGAFPLISSDANFAFAVRPKDVIDYLKNLPDQPITFSYDPEKMLVLVTFDTGFFKFNCADAELYPKALTLSNSHRKDLEETILNDTTIEVDMLCRAIEVTLPSATVDDKRPILNGICMDFLPSGLTFAATNAFILSTFCDLKTVSSPEKEQARRIVLPYRTATFLRGFLPRYSGESIKISHSSARIIFSLDNIEITSSLVAGAYPNYSSIIPKENPRALIVEAKVFIAVIRRMNVFIPLEDAVVKIELKEGIMRLHGTAPNAEKEAHETLPVQFPEDIDITMKFGIHDLLSILSSFDEGEVVFNFSDKTRPLVITPAEPNERVDIKALICPKTC